MRARASNCCSREQTRAAKILLAVQVSGWSKERIEADRSQDFDKPLVHWGFRLSIEPAKWPAIS
jgi:hypothetical protein